MAKMGDAEESGASSPDEASDGPQRVGVLRGAGVQVDVGRVGQWAAVLGMVAIMVTAGVLLVAGVRKNSQIDSLKANGVPVEATVVKCLALVGGTGQSPAGFECTGTYVYRGIRHTQGVPGSINLPVGSTVHGVVASNDPALFSTPQTVASEHASDTRVVLPAVVLAVSTGLCIWVIIRRRSRGVAC